MLGRGLLKCGYLAGPRRRTLCRLPIARRHVWSCRCLVPVPKINRVGMAQSSEGRVRQRVR